MEWTAKDLDKDCRYLWWSYQYDASKLPEMNPATEEQLEKIDIYRNEKGVITGAKFKTDTKENE